MSGWFNWYHNGEKLIKGIKFLKWKPEVICHLLLFLKIGYIKILLHCLLIFIFLGGGGGGIEGPCGDPQDCVNKFFLNFL